MIKGPVARSLVVVSLAMGMLAIAAPANAAQYCSGRRATIVGTSGPDVLYGRPYRTDVIVGLGGNDYISGGNDYPENGNPPDFICAGLGAGDMTRSCGIRNSKEHAAYLPT